MPSAYERSGKQNQSFATETVEYSTREIWGIRTVSSEQTFHSCFYRSVLLSIEIPSEANTHEALGLISLSV